VNDLEKKKEKPGSAERQFHSQMRNFSNWNRFDRMIPGNLRVGSVVPMYGCECVKNNTDWTGSILTMNHGHAFKMLKTENGLEMSKVKIHKDEYEPDKGTGIRQCFAYTSIHYKSDMDNDEPRPFLREDGPELEPPVEEQREEMERERKRNRTHTGSR